MKKEAEKAKIAEWILRIGVFGTFLGHGIFALMIKQSWIPYFTSVGISETAAVALLPVIGIMDLIVAFSVLIRPLKIILIWATLWGFTTALIRPISGEPILDFVERSSNWAAPLALFYLIECKEPIRKFITTIVKSI